MRCGACCHRRSTDSLVQVTGRVFDTLLYFVEHAGQLLDKRTLMEALWPNVVVEESNLTQTIHTLRRVLGERPEEHRFIVTVPGRGYRFVADVKVRAAAAPERIAAETQGKADRAPLDRWRMPAFVAVSLVLAAALLLVSRWPGPTPRTPPEQRSPSIAVLPFVDMSPEGDQRYFSDGLSEEILNLLAQSSALRVIARTSSFSFRDQNADIATIADKLNVTHVLEGSVRKSGERIRITAQLVDATNSAHLWSQTYDRGVKDIFAVQTEIAASVAESLRVTLTGSGRPGLGETSNTQAFERYLQGRYFFNRRGASDVARAKDYFEQALQIDPGYGRAWTGLAGAYFVADDADKRIAEHALEKWREAVEKAVTLSPNLVEAHVRAAQYYWADRRRPSSRRTLQASHGSQSLRSPGPQWGRSGRRFERDYLRAAARRSDRPAFADQPRQPGYLPHGGRPMGGGESRVQQGSRAEPHTTGLPGRGRQDPHPPAST